MADIYQSYVFYPNVVLIKRGAEPYVYRQGWVATPNVIVGVYAQGKDDRFKEHEVSMGIVDLTFVHDGRTYSWRRYREYSDRYIVTLCKRFSAQVVEQQCPEVSHG